MKSRFVPDEERDWNINQGMGDIIVGLIHTVNESAKVGETDYFNSLRALFRNVCGYEKMDDKEMQGLDSMFWEIKSMLLDNKPITDGGKREQDARYRQALRKLDELHIRLIKECWRSGLIQYTQPKHQSSFSALEI